MRWLTALSTVSPAAWSGLDQAVLKGLEDAPAIERAGQSVARRLQMTELCQFTGFTFAMFQVLAGQHQRLEVAVVAAGDKPKQYSDDSLKRDDSARVRMPPGQVYRT
jgi:hypothetical protein